MRRRAKFPKGQRDSGLTLIEVIVTLTVLGLIVVILFSAFRLGLSAWDRGETVKEEDQKVRILSELLSRQIKSAFPYRVRTEKAEGDYLAFEGRSQSLKFVSSLPMKRNRSEGFVYTLYQYEENGTEGGRLLFYEERALRKGFFEEEPKREKAETLIEGISKFSFEYYQEEDSSKNQMEQWFQEWDGREKKELPKAIRVNLSLRGRGGETSFSLLLPISAYQFEPIRIPSMIRRTLPRGGP